MAVGVILPTLGKGVAWLKSWTLSELFKQRLQPSSPHAMVDRWVLGCLVVALLSLASFIPMRELLGWRAVLVGVLGLYRLYEICVHQSDLIVNPDPPPADARRYLLLSVINYAEVIVWFAFAYRALSREFSDPDTLNTLTGSLYFSVITVATVGYGDIHPCLAVGRALVIAQVMIGLFLTLVVVARAVGTLGSSLEPRS